MAIASALAPMMVELSPRSRARSDPVDQSDMFQTFHHSEIGDFRHTESGMQGLAPVERSASGLSLLPHITERIEGPDDVQYSLFPDPTKMKETLRKQMLKEEYHVEALYRSEGVWQRLARSSRFEKLTFFVILLNAIWIGYDTEVNDYALVIEAPAPYFIIENLFCAYFTFELLVRLLSFRRKRDSLNDGWFRFDAFLVLLMVLETWVLTLVLALAGYHSASRIEALSIGSAILQIGKLARLFRLARVVRLVRAFPELVIMMKGMFLAARAVILTLCMLLVLMYVFGIIFTELSEGTSSGDAHFGHLGTSMVTLLVQGTLLDDLAELTQDLLYDWVHFHAWYLFFLFYAYVFLSALTMLNMLIGVVCETVSTVAAIEREHNSIHMVKRRLQRIINQAHPETAATPAEHDPRTISRESFRVMLEKPEAVQSLSEVGVDVVGLVDIADFLFEDHRMTAEDSGTTQPSLTVSEFIELILRLRGSNWATVKDLVETRRFFRTTISSLERHILALPGAGSRSSEAGVPPRRSLTPTDSTRLRSSCLPPRRSPTPRKWSWGDAALGSDVPGEPGRRSGDLMSLGHPSRQRSAVLAELPLLEHRPKMPDAPRAETSESLGESLAAKAAQVEEAIRAAQQSFSSFIQAAAAEAQATNAVPLPGSTVGTQEKNDKLLQLATVARSLAASDSRPSNE